MAQLRNANIDEYQPDPENLNKGTERGEYMIRQSLAKLGAGRSIVVDAKGRTIGGAHVLQAAEDLNLSVVEVVTDGTELVVVKRVDLDYDETDRARELSIADNRVNQVNLNFDVEQLIALSQTVDLKDFFTDSEFKKMGAALEVETKVKEFKEYDESIADKVEMTTCPHCGKTFAK